MGLPLKGKSLIRMHFPLIPRSLLRGGFIVTEHPTAQWTARQIVEAFPWDTAPRYLLRDRDSIYGAAFQNRVRNLGLEDVKITPQSPWQNPYCERVIGSIRRDALDHVIVLNERHLRRVLRTYVNYYHHWRTHLSLEMDTPASRAVQPPDFGSGQETTRSRRSAPSL